MTAASRAMQATKLRKGQKIDPNSPQVINYKSYLESRHDAVLGSVGGGKKLYSYGYVFNGFAAELERRAGRQAAQRRPACSRSRKTSRWNSTRRRRLLSWACSGPGGVWATTGAKGENVIIGIVDGGAWPEHPSFSDRTGVNGNATKDGKLGYQQIPGWNGKCMPGEQFTASNCNQKLIGARYYNAGWGGNAGIDAQLPWEFNSPRDYGGHGTHTSTTAGGNAERPGDRRLAAAFGKVSGIAPRARIAAYKVCWQTADRRQLLLLGQRRGDRPGRGRRRRRHQLLDQRIADELPRLRRSRVPVCRGCGRIRRGLGRQQRPDDQHGCAPGSVAHDGCRRHSQPQRHQARSRSATGRPSPVRRMRMHARSRPLVRSKDAGLPGVDAAKLALCFGASDVEAPHDGTPTLDPAKVAGKIVVCERGGNVLVNKSQAVLDAGGAGMVLLNTPTSNNTQLAILHVIPTVHVGPGAGNADYTAIDTYAATPGATASIAQSTIVLNVPAPLTAASSSRGPLRASGDLLKPDVMAPGTDVLAGVAPPGNSGKLFDLYSGTSMSSPHVAGLAALFKEMHPNWSPMMIKSALMTTGYDTSSTAARRREHQPGADFPPGRRARRRRKAIDPGLVFNHGLQRLARIPVRRVARRRRCGDVQCVGRTGVFDRPERPERGVDRNRRPGRDADGHAHGHERRHLAGYVQRSASGLAGIIVTVTPVHVDAGSRADEDVPVTFAVQPRR